MARNFYTPINLNGLVLQAAAIGNLSTTSINAITSGTGRIQYDSTLNVLKYRDNTGWQTISTGGGSFTLGSTSIALGSTTTTIAGLSSVTSTTFVGALTGNASTATALQTGRTINGTAFDGTANITVTASTTGTLTFGTGLTAAGSSFNGSTGVTITPVSATTSVAGIVQLSDSTSTTSSVLAATATAAKAAYDRGSTGVTNAATAQTTADNALPKAGGTMSGAIAMGNNKITGLGTPTDAGDAATKSYVDNVSTGVNIHDAVVAATTGTIAGVYAAGSTTANPPGDGGTGVGATITYSTTGVVTLDTSVTLAAGDRVLVKDGVTAAAGASSIANGIYVVTTAGAVGTAAVLTRATDADNSHFGDLSAGDLVYVIGGNTYAGDQFVQTVKGTATQGIGADTTYSIKIGTDAISYTQFSGAGAVPTATTSTLGIASFSSSQFSVSSGAVSINNLAGSIITSGTVSPTYGGTGVNNGSKTITLSGNTTIGSSTHTVAFTTSANTSVALPSTGTLATLDGSEALTNKTYNGLTVTSSTGTLTVANSKTVTVNNTLTLAGTDSTTMTFPSASGTLARKATQVGSGSGTTISWTNTWSTNLVTAQVYDTSTSTATLVECDITATTSAVVATFASSTTLSNYTLVITG